jgi:uncharacterized protein (TIGR03382 family)
VDPGDPGDPGDPDIDPPDPGDFGAPCDDGNMCDSNACASAGSNGYCTEECAESSCPYGYECRALDVGQFCLLGDAAGAGPEVGTVGMGATGCSTSGRGASSASVLIVLFALAMLRRRR